MSIPYTMPRLKSVTDEQLLEAARAEFLRNGASASTVQIARRAGVSEALLFKRFASKEQLFARALRCQQVAEWIDSLEARVGQGEVRTHLVELCTAMVTCLATTLPQMMMLWSVRSLGPPEDPSVLPPQQELQALTRYLQAEMERGRLRAHRPETMARVLQGAVVNHVFMELMGIPTLLPTDTFVSELVDGLWRGLAPECPAQQQPPPTPEAVGASQPRM